MAPPTPPPARARAAAPADPAAASAQLNLVGYSTPKKAYDALTSAFAQTGAGKGVSFQSSFGASGSQSRAVDSGQPADVVAFSTTPDMTRLVKDKLVAVQLGRQPREGLLLGLGRRDGRAQGQSQAHHRLGRPGQARRRRRSRPNPSTSGSARWNILAGYGAELKEGKSPAQALAYVKTLLTKNVSVQDASASAALQTFTSGKGDVLLDYESDAISAEKKGDAVSYVIPKQTILIQTPIAVTAKTTHAAQANAFLKYQWSPAGQKIWAQQGYRPVDPAVAKQFAVEVPHAAAAVHDRLPGRLEEGQEDVLRSGRGFDHQDRAGRRRSGRVLVAPMASISATANRAGRAGLCPGRPGAVVLGLGLSTLYLSVIVLIPLAAVAAKAADPEPVGAVGLGQQRRPWSRR